MIHELDTVIREYAQDCLPRTPVARLPAAHGASRRRVESARLGIRCSGRAMQPDAMRILETTWRIWREPLA